jgi:hypothetical protein
MASLQLLSYEERGFNLDCGKKGKEKGVKFKCKKSDRRFIRDDLI